MYLLTFFIGHILVINVPGNMYIRLNFWKRPPGGGAVSVRRSPVLGVLPRGGSGGD